MGESSGEKFGWLDTIAGAKLEPKKIKLKSLENVCFHERFPVEVWEIILKYLKDDPVALTNCAQACSKLRNILSKDKSFLFPVVLPFTIMASSSNMNITFSDVLNWRLISKPCKEFIDELLQKQSRHQIFSLRFEYKGLEEEHKLWRVGDRKYIAPGTYSFSVPRHFQRAMDAMQDHPGNPFVGRAVMFQTLLNNMPDDYYYDVLQSIRNEGRIEFNNLPSLNPNDMETQTHHLYLHRLLRKFGEDIWHFTYVGLDAMVSGPSYLIEVLKFLPYLRSFTLKHRQYFYGYGHQETVSSPDIVCRRSSLPRKYVEHQLDQLAKLPDLRSLNINVNAYCLASELLLEKYGHQLEVLVCDNRDLLKISRLFLGEYEIQGGAEYSFPNLKTLKVWIGTRPGNLALLRSLKSLEMPKLETLSLQLDVIWMGEDAFWNLFTAVSKFSPTLVELILEHKLCKAETCQECDSLSDTQSCNEFVTEMKSMEGLATLEFPKLKSLTINAVFLRFPVLRRILKKCVAIKKLELLSSKCWMRNDGAVKELKAEFPTLEVISFLR